MNQENITRTLATGQSDITRHEAYTKATGLNWFNSLTPSYTNNNDNLILKLMLEIVKRSVSEIPEDAKIVLFTGFPLRPSGIYNINYARVAISIPMEEVVEGLVFNWNAIEVITTNEGLNGYDYIGVECLTDSNSQYTSAYGDLYLITTTCTNVDKATGSLSTDPKIEIPLADLEELFDLSLNLIDTNMELYYALGGK